ncbi:hypothetical protein SMC26_28965 [Actinomadura fulvescens]|uniref:Uncharacterized protein n=1 Tax=Actinomadura fulvescens TaxID=46160 RepID=A0ABN3Q139_9ACTN
MVKAEKSAGQTGLLGIYLNDHLAGATGGVELARRVAGAKRNEPDGEVLRGLAREIAEDRDALLEIMDALGVPVRRYKVIGAWAAEKAGRLKLNGRIVGRSPLSDLVELEMLRLGVEGKSALWGTLRTMTDPALDGRRLDGLFSRARRQSAMLDDLRLRAASEALR